ncbi:MAG: circularly permuted type 2 ATP-grasp protein [Cyanobacteria bacterium J06648_10]
MSFQDYDPGDFFDELFSAQGLPREAAALLIERLESLSIDSLIRRQQAAQHTLFKLGVTFNVYSDNQGTERVFPFDVVPRVISGKEWQTLEKGLQQRITALNYFLDDIYNDQKIIKDGVISREVVESASGYLPPCKGLKPPKGVWCHITGTDLVRDRAGTWYVLEDNLRCPSGASYVLENRTVMKSSFPSLFEALDITAVDDYPSQLLTTLRGLAPDHISDPTVVLLTPGTFNSAYFEHSFLAQQMGIPLVEGRDLIVDDGYVKMRTTKGLYRVDVIYRRIDDEFIDPTIFRSDSMLGVPGMMDVYRQGRVAIANAPGTGVADDKLIYAYAPQMIRYYLGEEQIIPNVPTYFCQDEKQQSHVLSNLDSLVVKATDASGGYGMLMGTHSSKEEQNAFAEKIKSNPRGYIAQPTLCLSRMPTLIDRSFQGRHIDLRPFILFGRAGTVSEPEAPPYVHPGGLTRVALKKDSLVVNSSQGGGSKDTWIIN